MKHQNRRHKPKSVGAPQPLRQAGAAAFYARGLSDMRSGNHRSAESHYRLCLAADPAHGDSHHHLGLLLAKRGAFDEAAAVLRKAVEHRPDNADALAQLCMVLRSLGRPVEAVERARAAVALAPRSATAHRELGLALLQNGQRAESATALAEAIACDPRDIAAHTHLAGALRALGQSERAIATLDRCLVLDPHSAEAFNERGLLHEEAGRWDDALADFSTAHKLDPTSAIICTNLAHVHLHRHTLDEALTFARKAIALDPTDGSAIGNLGMIYQRQGRAKEAIETFSQAIAQEPSCIRHYTNLGALLIAIEQTDTAIAACRLAVQFGPEDAEAHFNLAVALRQKGLLADAMAAYRRSHARGNAQALVDVCHLRQQLCDWPGLADEQIEARRTTYRVGKSVAPFSVLTAIDSPAEHRLCAEVNAATFPKPRAPLAAYNPRPTERRGAPIRIGYLSSDLFQHATTSLIAELFERHDRSRFSLTAYSYGPDDRSGMRQRVIDAFDAFVDLREVSHVDAARRIKADNIDILIDLKGYTQGARTDILAYRPAPIQVNYLGYPGTMGAPFVDYLIADPFVAPASRADDFSEKIVHLPHCYQPNDRLRPIASNIGERSSFGLPEHGFVFCSFNNSYKITPDVFAVWMRLLHATPGSVLWLLQTNDTVVTNLRREAQDKGIAPERLVFAPRISADRHIARMVLADLFLDTGPVNAHTTASEALWAGLPVLTCAGESFVSRVAGSLLHAIGLPDLVTHSLADYEAKANHLVADRPALATLRERLRANRLTTPLFDIESYTRDFESALERMCALRDAGRPPEAFAV